MSALPLLRTCTHVCDSAFTYTSTLLRSRIYSHVHISAPSHLQACAHFSVRSFRHMRTYLRPRIYIKSHIYPPANLQKSANLPAPAFARMRTCGARAFARMRTCPRPTIYMACAHVFVRAYTRMRTCLHLRIYTHDCMSALASFQTCALFCTATWPLYPEFPHMCTFLRLRS